MRYEAQGPRRDKSAARPATAPRAPSRSVFRFPFRFSFRFGVRRRAPRAGRAARAGCALAALLAGAGLLAACAGAESGSRAGHGPGSGVRLPPESSGFDYQIGGAYAPPSGVGVLSRDHASAPSAGRYTVCYVNAFQAQPGAEDDWPADLLLRDRHGKPVVDTDWDERLLDIGTAAKRSRVAARIGRWTNECARKGFQAIEPDNYDSYTRSRHTLRARDAEEFMALLSAHAHKRGLAVGQKNTPALAGSRKRTGVDFAVAEECGRYAECGVYTRAFPRRVFDIEYTDAGLARACAHAQRRNQPDQLSVVRRDLDVTRPGRKGYVRRTCPGRTGRPPAGVAVSGE